MLSEASPVCPIEAQQRYWDERWERHPTPNGWQKRRATAILELLRPLSLQGITLLDVGCATGWFTAALSEFGTASGLDLSEQAIRIARQSHPHISYSADNFLEMELPAATYDLVVSQEVVAHVPDQQRFVERLGHILKPGGYLVITAANKLVMERVDFGPDPDAHIKKWLSMRDLKALLDPWFRVLRTTSVIPLGDRGILRLVNSHKLNRALALCTSEQRLTKAKERAGLGYSLIVLAVKR